MHEDAVDPKDVDLVIDQEKFGSKNVNMPRN